MFIGTKNPVFRGSEIVESIQLPKWVLSTFLCGGVRVNIWGMRLYKEVIFGVCELQLKKNSIF